MMDWLVLCVARGSERIEFVYLIPAATQWARNQTMEPRVARPVLVFLLVYDLIFRLLSPVMRCPA